MRKICSAAEVFIVSPVLPMPCKTDDFHPASAILLAIFCTEANRSTSVKGMTSWPHVQLFCCCCYSEHVKLKAVSNFQLERHENVAWSRSRWLHFFIGRSSVCEWNWIRFWNKHNQRRNVCHDIAPSLSLSTSLCPVVLSVAITHHAPLHSLVTVGFSVYHFCFFVCLFNWPIFPQFVPH